MLSNQFFFISRISIHSLSVDTSSLVKFSILSCITLSILTLLFFIFLAVLGLHCCAWAFSSCGKQELLFVAVHGLLIAVASPVVEHGL